MASDSASQQQRMITLRTADNHEFVVEQSVAEHSLTLKTLIDDLDEAGFIPITEINATAMSLIIEYCKKHSSAKPGEEKDLEKFDSNLLEGKDRQFMLDLVLAVNYLHIPKLLDFVCVKIADSIKDLPHQVVRKLFGQENDYTPEEEQNVRNEYLWAFENFPANDQKV